jgi:hypothetical protein
MTTQFRTHTTKSILIVLANSSLDERLNRIPKSELQKFAFWVPRNPDVPGGRWYKDFGTFKVCDAGPTTTTFLDVGMDAFGEKLEWPGCAF